MGSTFSASATPRSTTSATPSVPRSREIQDILVGLDKNLADLFTHLDQKVGRGNYVVALSADHGGTPIPEDMQKTGVDAGRLNLAEVQDKIEKVLESFNYPKPGVARITGNDIYFAPGIYDRLQLDGATRQAVIGRHPKPARSSRRLSCRSPGRSPCDAKLHAVKPLLSAISMAAVAISFVSPEALLAPRLALRSAKVGKPARVTAPPTTTINMSLSY